MVPKRISTLSSTLSQLSTILVLQQRFKMRILSSILPPLLTMSSPVLPSMVPKSYPRPPLTAMASANKEPLKLLPLPSLEEKENLLADMFLQLPQMWRSMKKISLTISTYLPLLIRLLLLTISKHWSSLMLVLDLVALPTASFLNCLPPTSKLTQKSSPSMSMIPLAKSTLVVLTNTLPKVPVRLSFQLLTKLLGELLSLTSRPRQVVLLRLLRVSLLISTPLPSSSTFLRFQLLKINNRLFPHSTTSWLVRIFLASSLIPTRPMH